MFLSTSSVTTALVLCLAITNVEAITKCTKDENTCGCKTEKGTISLKKYADKGFKDSDPGTAYVYYWNPCKDFTIGSSGIPPVTASCVQEISQYEHYDCGSHKTLQTSADKDGNAVFNMDSADTTRHSVVTCRCQEGAGDVFKFIREDPMTPGIYYMSLTGDTCCPQSGGGQGGSGGLSVGSVLLIVFFVVLVVYLVGGMVVQTVVRKAEGRERIPNLSLWTAVPGLIKDGIRFTCSCGKSKGYDSI
ncbi:cation-dependent mannose-6-phosphate receptor-like isoform X2 [Elysia marginata]|uniref:Cation-dependent mannose-6-phosphate receptor-like isoform X2 n=1 Tax=Elysia marginata TaxID=1093978 RepID=A0AAV4JYM8_9GAST|nr:cation-dependent mannose-6-phosphate receptor-like isoform X2 [Elysia marginata]